MSKENKNEIALQPERTCDIVMKGGVTSGIVYPKAIYELSKEYRFVNIGGTSAGAIAAALTAAAEYNRRVTGSSEGFNKLLNLPKDLSEDTNGVSKLFSLFKPNKSTEKIFNILMNIYKQKNKFRKYLISFLSLIFSFPILSIILMLPSILTVYALRENITNMCLYTLNSILIVFLNLGCMLVINFIYGIVKFTKTVENNHFGLTTGNFFSQESLNNESSLESLTPWLSNLINEIAGKNKNDSPLTFGDLKKCKGHGDAINLQMVTTNLTWRRPHTVPFENKGFYFDEIELRNFFPSDIINWMVSKSNSKRNGKYALPKPDDLPIIFTTRMSLSFPILFSAVPLYAVDYKNEKNQQDPQNSIPEKCFFSDGGICSNFPIHFFDSPLPSRPTFAFNLDKYPNKDESKQEYDDISAAKDNNWGINPVWYRFENSLLEFIKSIFGTMQNWQDNIQLMSPGYRDRIVSIHLSKEEGGLNLSMDKDTILKISNRGELAGKVLRERFTGKIEHKLDWNNHRWIRFRNTMSTLEEYLTKIEEGLKAPSTKFETGYIDLLKREKKDPPLSYRFEVNHRISAIKKIEQLLEFISFLKKDNKSFSTGSPKPTPEIKIKPKI